MSPVSQLRLRLKADGRVVEILPDGSERTVGPQAPAPFSQRAERNKPERPSGASPLSPAEYARSIRAATKLTQAQFAERLGVPIETVRNWEQGKRAPRGPARALLRVIELAPDVAFAALAKAR